MGTLLTLWSSSPAWAVSEAVVISEVMPGSIESQGKEFIELYNNSDQSVSLSGWKLEYKSATGKTWSKRALLEEGDAIPAHAYVVLHTDKAESLHLSSGMAQTGSNVRLRDADGGVVDQLAWGDGDSAEGEAAIAPALGQSLTRDFATDKTKLVDSDNNAADFRATSIPTEAAAPVSDDEPAPDEPSVVADPSQQASVIINELLPDPQTPLSDSKDEFIELYNQGATVVKLNGWSLRDRTNHIFRIGDVEIASRGFAVLKSSLTKLSLNNDGDEITLVDPAGNEVDQSSDYGAAKAGTSWGLSDGAWSWLSEPTPGATNATARASAESVASEKKATVKKSSSKKAPKATAKKAKKSSRVAAASTKAPTAYSPTEVTQNARLWSWLLIGLGTGTIGYGIYAYRPEITHIIYKLRAKLSNR
jgi:predicted extracellular nuclease